MGKDYCPKCGLQYRKSQIKMRMGICEDCDPTKFKEQYEKDLVYMQKRKVGQKHITEHTFFPEKPIDTRWYRWYRRENR